jgi:hypothetical protein
MSVTPHKQLRVYSYSLKDQAGERKILIGYAG